LAIYRHPRSWTIGFAVGGPATVITLALLVIFALRDNQLLVASGFLIVAPLLIVPLGWLISHIAREVQISDATIIGRPFLGPATGLKWSEIQSSEQFVVFSLQPERVMVYRLVADGGRSIAFTSQIGGFDELMSAISLRTHALRTLTRPVWWRRIIFRGFP